ncbi:glycosyltransferase family 4 protein [Aeromicrobium piscarium]|uniref:glycosyltransferase family 4 protein n=1 Tax=Aeromicrobium piscarium TaxID=2590901 RepID=UPI00163DC191|nr:glycosyltransferase family 4 protein [Aeromicrobium piscarium]
MTQILVEELTASSAEIRLADRRFSKEVGDIGNLSGRKVVAAVGLLGRVLRMSRHADCAIFFVTNRPASFLVDCVISLVLRAKRIPTLGYVHALGYERLARRGRVWRQLVRIHFSCASTVVCLSPRLAHDVAPFVRKEARIETVPNTILDVDDIPARSSCHGVVTYFSNFIPEKGIADFIALSRSISDIRFVAAGSPVDEEQLGQLRRDSPPNLEIVGQALGRDKRDLWSKTSILVFPSRYEFEAQPLTIIEALSKGIPVIAYDVGGVGDLVDDGTNGYLLPEGDVAGMKRAIEGLINNSDELARLGAGARNTFIDNHSRSAFRNAWIKLLGDYA